MRKMKAVRYLRAVSAVCAVVLCAGVAAATSAPWATPRPAAARTCALQICYSSFDCHCGPYVRCQIPAGASNGVCVL